MVELERFLGGYCASVCHSPPIFPLISDPFFYIHSRTGNHSGPYLEIEYGQFQTCTQAYLRTIQDANFTFSFLQNGEFTYDDGVFVPILFSASVIMVLLVTILFLVLPYTLQFRFGMINRQCIRSVAK